MNYKDIIEKEFRASIEIKQIVLQDEDLLSNINGVANLMIDSLKNGNKILLCGNGGSASDSLHIAGELLGRFQKERKAYAAVSLNADVATMTAIANDYGYDQVFARQVQGMMNEGDILFGISTSGNSKNVVKAFEQAKELGGKTVLLAGKDGGVLKNMADVGIVVPCDVTAHVQEVHICIYHILCEIIELELLKTEK